MSSVQIAMAASMALDLAGIVVEDFSVMGKWNEMCNRSLTIFCKCCYKMVVVAATLQSIWFEKKNVHIFWIMHPTKYLVGCVIQKGFSNSELRGRKVFHSNRGFFSVRQTYMLKLMLSAEFLKKEALLASLIG